MIARSSTALVEGARVRLLVDGCGEVEGEGEVHFAAGALGRVASVDLYDNDQGVVVTVVVDGGVANNFDHLDGPLSNFLELAPEPAVERAT